MLLPLGIAHDAHRELHQRRAVGQRSAIPTSPGASSSRRRRPATYATPRRLYEGILDISRAVLLLLIARKPADGVVAWTWFTYYGITRTVAEIWREPGFTVIGLSGGQLVALPMVFIGAACLAAIRATRHAIAAPTSRRVACPPERGLEATRLRRSLSGRCPAAREVDASSLARRPAMPARVTRPRRRPKCSRRSAPGGDRGRPRPTIGENYLQEAREKYAACRRCASTSSVTCRRTRPRRSRSCSTSCNRRPARSRARARKSGARARASAARAGPSQHLADRALRRARRRRRALAERLRAKA